MQELFFSGVSLATEFAKNPDAIIVGLALLLINAVGQIWGIWASVASRILQKWYWRSALTAFSLVTTFAVIVGMKSFYIETNRNNDHSKQMDEALERLKSNVETAIAQINESKGALLTTMQGMKVKLDEELTRTKERIEKTDKDLTVAKTKFDVASSIATQKMEKIINCGRTAGPNQPLNGSISNVNFSSNFQQSMNDCLSGIDLIGQPPTLVPGYPVWLSGEKKNAETKKPKPRSKF